MPPEAGFVKFNCDTSWDPAIGLAGIGSICRDNEGQVKFIKAMKEEGVKDIVAAESRAMFISMREVAKKGIHKVIFTSDNAELIQGLLGGSTRSTSEPSWIVNCKRFLNLFAHWRLELVLREGNVVADLIAQKALCQGWEWLSSDAIPLCISQVVKKDLCVSDLL
ncbi:hypothetical protein QQ045_023390 [Rhodiola kirilowii]